jgi:hypothetical protein
MTSAGLVRRASTLATATAVGVLGWSATATGCPVCFVADERARQSFLGTAVLLSALPFALVAGIAFWLWRETTRPR